MKHQFISVTITCLSLVSMGAGAHRASAAGADRQGKGPLKVFILAGQSNMVA